MEALQSQLDSLKQEMSSKDEVMISLQEKLVAMEEVRVRSQQELSAMKDKLNVSEVLNMYCVITVLASNMNGCFLIALNYVIQGCAQDLSSGYLLAKVVLVK